MEFINNITVTTCCVGCSTSQLCDIRDIKDVTFDIRGLYLHFRLEKGLCTASYGWSHHRYRSLDSAVSHRALLSIYSSIARWSNGTRSCWHWGTSTWRSWRSYSCPTLPLTWPIAPPPPQLHPRSGSHICTHPSDPRSPAGTPNCT